MTIAVPKPKMTADEFIAWAMAQPSGRYELAGGEVVAMAPERVRHADAKGDAYVALREAIRARRLPCKAYPDGMAVRIDDLTVYEPDAALRCGPPLSPDATEYADPLVIVEVLSPSTRSIDSGAKLADYFRLPSVRHYLILKTDTRTLIHHRRAESGDIATRILRDGALRLDPPGLEIPVAAFFVSLEPEPSEAN